MDGGQAAGWTEAQAEDVGDALVAGLAASGVDHLFFTSGSEIGFFQEATAKARARGHNKPDPADHPCRTSMRASTRRSASRR